MSKKILLENIKKYDKSNMKDMILSFPNQIRDSFEIMKNFKVQNNDFNNILVCGMGGSAIAGDICKEITHDSSDLFLYVNRDYKLPKWVDKKTLVIISSYSGNTEETISCYKESMKRKIKPVVITTGGFLLDQAIKNNQSHIKFPSGFQPRAAIGYSISLLMLILNKFKVIKNNLIHEIENSLSVIEKQNNQLSMLNNHNESIVLAGKIYNKFAIIYIDNHLESIALRFRCQLAENAKILSSHFIFPEQNHNEIEAFEKSCKKDLAIVWIYTNNDYEKIKDRMIFTSRILKSIKNQYNVVKTESHNIQNILTLINFFDWVSYYCAMYNKIDPTPVNSIKKIKSMI
ncbi:MAG: bifunctional phosphoglucose/phosphomannose isomerase [Candidatus Marinimicrobia bacterium]|nr:bifunctional phosphoglucose/phosphomannose isomerase [Candidatus Neomarinimicrobiota bacterium]|tara:strand:- start:17760 stop:18794 length:1035 start_codon:yes stop_codon:yes gene_type:complete